MKKKSILLFFLCLVKLGIGQTISPAETSEFCPHPDYENAVANQTNVHTFTLTVDGNMGDYFLIPNTSTSDPNKPVACKIVAGLPGGNGNTGTFQVAFEDQRATKAKFTLAKFIAGGETIVVKTFEFSKIRSIKGLKPTLIALSPVDLPLCTTGDIIYSFQEGVRYTLVGTTTKYGGVMPNYEYSVPAGWKVGNIVSTDPNNYITAVPGASITYDEFNTGEVKVRATQWGYLCGPDNYPAPGDWATITTVTRPVLKLTTNGNTSLALTCGQSSTHTFTVENGDQASCFTYEWNLGSASNNWLHNGSPAAQVINTSNNSLTLTSATCGGAPSNVSVTVKKGAVTVSTQTVTVSMPLPQFSITGNNAVCNTGVYTINNLPCNASVQWVSSAPAVATVSGSGNQCTVTKVSDGLTTISATITGACGPVVKITKEIEAGAPTSWYDITSEDNCFAVYHGYHFTAELTSGLQVSEFEWGYREFGSPNDVVLPFATSDNASFAFNHTGIYGVYAKPKNACGTGLKSSKGIHVVNFCDGESPLQFRTSPNPVKSELLVTIDEAKVLKGTEKQQRIDFYIYKFNNGQLAKHYSLPANQKQYRLNVQGLTKGTYVLTILKGAKRISKQISID